jgi:glycosyltransferase involved in cell wall biosynthesis
MTNDINPFVSIITVVFNGVNLIEKTIKNVISQTYGNIEYIIIDGGSTDGTIEIIKKYADRIAFWSSEPDSGIYDAMNKGIDAATGEYVWFINVGDEIYDTTTLSNVIARGSNAVDVYYGKTQLIYSSEQVKKIIIPPKILTWKSLSGGRGSIDVCHQSIIIRRTLVDDYDLGYKFTADHDWMIRALKKSKIIINTQIVLSKYLLNGFTANNHLNCWKDRFRIVYKYYGILCVIRTGFLFILVYTKRAASLLLKHLSILS